MHCQKYGLAKGVWKCGQMFWWLVLWIMRGIGYCLYGCRKNTPARHKWTRKECAEIYDSTGGRCFYCDRKLTYKYKRQGHWEVDHVWCLHKGGSDTRDNLVPACFHCNRSKGTQTPHEWVATLGKSLRCRTRIPSTGRLCLATCLASSETCLYHTLLSA